MIYIPTHAILDVRKPRASDYLPSGSISRRGVFTMLQSDVAISNVRHISGDRMKKIINLLKQRWIRPSRTYYYHDQVMTDELERELMKAYGSTGFGGKTF